jgi:hypothetical protein
MARPVTSLSSSSASSFLFRSSGHLHPGSICPSLVDLFLQLAFAFFGLILSFPNNLFHNLHQSLDEYRHAANFHPLSPLHIRMLACGTYAHKAFR